LLFAYIFNIKTSKKFKPLTHFNLVFRISELHKDVLDSAAMVAQQFDLIVLERPAARQFGFELRGDFLSILRYPFNDCHGLVEFPFLDENPDFLLLAVNSLANAE